MQMLDRPAHPAAATIAYAVFWPFLCFLILSGCAPQTETDRLTIRAEAARAAMAHKPDITLPAVTADIPALD